MIMKKKLLIKQPGHFGDILICLPIAKYYSFGHDVFWECPLEYHSTFRNIDYCTPVLTDGDFYDKVIDISFGLTDSPINTWWQNTKPRWQSFIIPKYIIAEVPIKLRWELSWNKNTERENLLYNIKVVNSNPYSLCHGVIRGENQIQFEPTDDYNVFDWYKIILNASEIHCIDSLLCNFVDVIPEALRIRKVYYQNQKVPNLWDRTMLINNWEVST